MCVYDLRCLNINRVRRVFLFVFKIVRLISTLAKSGCQTGVNKPKPQALENKVFEFVLSLSLSLSLSFSLVPINSLARTRC